MSRWWVGVLKLLFFSWLLWLGGWVFKKLCFFHDLLWFFLEGEKKTGNCHFCTLLPFLWKKNNTCTSKKKHRGKWSSWWKYPCTKKQIIPCACSRKKSVSWASCLQMQAAWRLQETFPTYVFCTTSMTRINVTSNDSSPLCKNFTWVLICRGLLQTSF